MKIGSLFNIDIKLSWSLWAFVFLFISPSILMFDLKLIFDSLLLLIMLYTSVLGHELSHSLMAKFFEYDTKEIQLNFLGGLALIDMYDANPIENIYISVAGPLFNIIIGYICFSILVTNPGGIFWSESEEKIFTSGIYLMQFMLLNIMMSFFNLIPAYPMDGGRILRSFLLLITKNEKFSITFTRNLALTIGIIFIIVGATFANIFSIITGLFIFFISYLSKSEV